MLTIHNFNLHRFCCTHCSAASCAN